MRDKQQGKICSIDRTIFEWSHNKLIVEVAKQPEEVRTLLEARFGYMCQKEIRGFLRNANELEQQKVARMRVPKMVKNGFNSVLQTSAGSRRQISMKNSRADAKPKAVPKSQKKNKNHLKPI